jgi:mono/diheme cytochrome c family protein
MGLMVATLSGQAVTAAPVPPEHSEKMTRGREVFKQHVRKVLLEQCVQCHGGAKTRAEFSLATRASLLRGGSKGPAVVPGKAADSLLVKVLRHEQEPHMPHQGDKLADDTLERITAWIDLGAPYDQPLVAQADTGDDAMKITDEDRRFWSFLPLDRAAPPSVQNDAWCRTDIDRFVLAALEAKGLSPNPSVDRRTLIRRASFDLIGLPPTPEQVDAFVNDPNPDAYAALLDRLFAGPHYGERWARHWLDIARFAESHGFEQDYDRPYAYHYRDFVIQALNQDLPYDTFVRWQLAGDEIAPDNPLAMTATGFLGAGVFPTQITANEVERTRYDALDDMAAAVGTAMLGLTVGCARCHDHKYDPIRTYDYYRLISTFTTTVRSDIELDFEPEIYRNAKKQYDREHAPLIAALQNDEKEKLPQRFDAWLAGRSGDATKPAGGWLTLDPVEHTTQSGARFAKRDDGSSVISGPNRENDIYTFVAHTYQRPIKAIRLEALRTDHQGPGRADDGNFALSGLRVTAKPLHGEAEAVAVKLVNPRATFEADKMPIAGVLDDNKRSAWSVAKQTESSHAAAFDVEGDVGYDGGTVLTVTLSFEAETGQNIARPRLALTTSTQPLELTAPATPQHRAELDALLATANDDPSKRAACLRWYRGIDEPWRALHRAEQDHQHRAPWPNLTKVMVCSEGFKPIRHHTQGADFFEQTYYLNRGDTDQKQSVATQGFLEVLMRSPDGEKHWQDAPPAGWRTSYRRTALANWITDTEYGPGHLLARVIVNRLWQHHMGRGIVATPSDFGYQGARPTHPELLDWLASELIRQGWRLKPIHKLIVSSSVYRQGSRFDPAKQAIDPVNALYWRRTPRRLEGEIIRDNILAVSGGLDPRMFGPGTLDENHRRRSIYFKIKRSKLIPMMQLFDAPEPLNGVGQRPSTTIAPQALMFMNNANLREHARRFAQRAFQCGMRNAECGVTAAVSRAYELALGREPEDAELAMSVGFLERQMDSYGDRGEHKRKMLAMTDFCQVLLGLNEFVYVE